jgi:hypothetical protein
MEGSTIMQLLQLQGVELDWRAYFDEFVALHGGDPVFHAETGRLLFRDGWMYAPRDYQGPEWGPPTEPRVFLRLTLDYWNERGRLLTIQRTRLSEAIRELDDIQRNRSAALRARVVTVDDNGKRVMTSAPIDIPLMRVRLQQLEDDLAQARNEQTRIGKELAGVT